MSANRTALVALSVGGLVLLGGGLFAGHIWGSSSTSSIHKQLTESVSTEHQKDLNTTFIAGMQLTASDQLEGRLRVREANLSSGEYRITMGRLYDDTGEPADVPPECTTKRRINGSSCEFIPDERAVTVYNPATAVE